MKILKQFGVIFGVCWVSLVIEHYLPFSFPAIVIGVFNLLCSFSPIQNATTLNPTPK